MVDFSLYPESESFYQGLEATGAGNTSAGRSIFQGRESARSGPGEDTIQYFKDAAVKYNVPADVLMSMAEKDSGFNEFNRSRGPGPKVRGIINVSDDEVARGENGNPYEPAQNINAAAQKLRSYLDAGMSVEDAVKAHIGGADPSRWGDDVNAYAQDVLSRTQRIAEAYIPEAAPRVIETETIRDAKGQAVPPTVEEQRQMFGIADPGRPGIGQQLGEDVQRGVANLGNLGRGLTGMAQAAVGDDAGAKATLDEYVKREYLNARENPAVIGSYKNIKDFGDAGRYAVEAIGENAAMFLPALATGGVGASIGRAITERAAARFIEDQVAKGMTREAAEMLAAKTVERGITVGAAAGAAPSTVGMETGSIGGDIYKETGEIRPGVALAGGVAAGALDLVEPVMAIRKAFGPSVAEPVKDMVIKAIARRVGIEGAKQFAVESGTEGLQTIIEQASTRSVDGKALFTPELLDEVIDSALKGGIGGGVLGVGSQAISEYQGRKSAEQPPIPAQQGVGDRREPTLDGSVTPEGDAPIVDPQTRESVSTAATTEAARDLAAEAPGRQAVSDVEQPVAPTPSTARPGGQGPLSRVLETGAPGVAPLATIAGQRVTLSDEMGSLTGAIVSQDADGVLFKSDDGAELLIDNDEISSGKVSIARGGEATVAPATDPAPAPAVEPPIAPVLETAPVVGQETPVSETQAAPPKAAGDIAEQAVAAITEPPVRFKRTYEDMSEPELRDRLKYIAGQAKAAGGWNKMLTDERKKVEKAINALKATPPALPDNEKPTSAGTQEAPQTTAPQIDAKKLNWVLGNTWGAKTAAVAAVENNGLSETHEVYEKGKSRYGVRAKAEEESADALQAPAPALEPASGSASLPEPAKLKISDAAAFWRDLGRDDRLGYAKLAGVDPSRIDTPWAYMRQDEQKSLAASINAEPGGQTPAPAPVVSAPVKENLTSEPSGNAGELESEAAQALAAEPQPFNEYGHYKGQQVYVIDNFGKRKFDGVVAGKAQTGGGVLINEPGKAGSRLIDNPMRVIAKAPAASVASETATDGNRSFVDRVLATRFNGVPAEIGPDGRAWRIKAENGAYIALRMPDKPGATPTYFRPAKGEAPWSMEEAAQRAANGGNAAPASATGNEPATEAPPPAVDETPDTGKNVGKPKRDAARQESKKEKAKGEALTQAAPAAEEPTVAAPAAESAAPAPAVSENTIFTKDEYEAARARFKARNKGTQFNSGINPEDMVDGIKMAGYHIEKGARTFAAFAEAMLADLGENIRPYLKSWYLGVKFDPRAANFDGMDSAGVVEVFDVDTLGKEQTQNGQDGQVDNSGNRRRVSGVESGREPDPQQAPASADLEIVGDGQPAAVETPDAGGDAGQDGVRDATADVGRNGPAGKRRNAADGRARNRRKGASDDGAGGTDGRVASPTAEDVNDVPPATPPASNFHIDNPLEIAGGGQVARFDKNRAAIELFSALRDAGRPATPEEQRVLAGYTGWGSFGQELFQGSWDYPRPKPEWKERSEWLRDHLGKEEWESAQNSIINAHYTDPPTVMAMWDMVRRMGFANGRVLEPGMGIGNFFGLMPKDMKERSKLSGIELDVLTGGMAKLLYPQSNVQVMSYVDSKTPDNFYDLVIGNWPFSNVVIADRRYNKVEPVLHDYYFLKALDQVRPGGLVIGITSNGTMDKKGTRVRATLAKKAELVAAIRLPTGAFQEYAGTKVVTDIVILKKRPEPLSLVPDDGWTKSVDYKTPSGQTISVNEYWLSHPQNVIGTLDWGHGTTSGRPGMIVHRPENMAERLRETVNFVPEGVYSADKATKHISYITNHTADREGALTTQDGKLYVVTGEHLAQANDVAQYAVKSAKDTAARETQLNALIDMRRKYAALIEAERAGSDAEPARKALNAAYKDFVKEHGLLGKSFGLGYLKKIDDPFYPTLAALEIDAKPAAILSRSTMRAPVRMGNPSIQDAYVMARNGAVSPSLAEIAAIAKKPDAEVKKALIESGAAFETPTGDVVPSDIYLSGNVRQKLREAEAAAKDNPALARNVEALREVQPKDIPYFNIETQFGATWAPPAVYADYVAHMLNRPSAQGIEVSFANGRWKITLAGGMNNLTEAMTGFGTAEMPFSRLVNLAVGNQVAKIVRKDKDGSYVDQKATEEANERIGKIRESFSEWLWGDPERRVAMESEYNEINNSFATPKYDGSFLSFVGMALQIGKNPFNLRKHQIDAIWRAIVNRKSINAHEVGTGKTFTMGGIAVESRRYGIAKKPLILAHNANSKSVASEIQQMYPAAKILYIDNLSPDTIDVKLRQIANDDWDAIVVPHSIIDRFTFKEETLMKMAQEEIDALEAEARLAAEEDGAELTDEMLNDEEQLKKLRSNTAKQLVKQRNAIIQSIRKQAQRAQREQGVTFEELGVDMIMVDEAHEFKKPTIATRMNLKGLNKSTSGRSIQLKFITDYVRAQNGGANVHLFTGTPITNTLTEIFHQMRYVMAEEMEAAGISDWDGWFGSFAREVFDIELNAAAEYEGVSRLAAFINVPELRRMIGQYMDVVFADDMPEMAPRQTKSGKTLASPDLTEAERAELLNGRTEGAANRPYKKILNVTSDMTDAQKRAFEVIQGWARAWRQMSPKDKKETMQRGGPESPIITEGVANKVSFDARLLEAERLAGQEGRIPDEPNSKISNVVRNVKEIYESHPMATQVIFTEMGQSDTVTRSEGRSADGEKMTRRAKVFSPVKDMIERLVASGIPREEIALVDGGTSKDRRKEIAQAMNEAKIRVVIGNTQTLGVGVNMQRNLRAMHHIDAPYMPGDLEQRNGRGHRQGNQWNTVLEFRYMTDRLDGRRWQILARKDTFIKAFMKANTETRTIEGDAAAEEESDILQSFAEAAGDPRILIREKLNKKLERLRKAERTHTRGIADAVQRRKMTERTVEETRGQLKALRDAGVAANAKKALADNAGENFRSKIGNTTYDKRKDFDAAYWEFVRREMRANGEPRVFGEFAGYKLTSEWRPFGEKPELSLTIGPRKFGGEGGIQSVESALRRFPEALEKIEGSIASAEATITRLKEVAAAPFQRAKDLADTQKQLADLDADIQANPVPPPAWLRLGAPTETEVFWDGQPFVVTGHRWTADGWFVVAEDAKGSAAIPYTEIADKQGMPIYEERLFEPPVVLEKKSDAASPAPEGDAMPSIGESAGMSPDALRDTLTSGKDGGFVKALIDAGKVAIQPTAKGMPAGAQAVTMPDGTIRLAASNLDASTARGVLLHEVFHSGVEPLVGQDNWKALLRRVATAADNAKAGSWVAEAKARAEAANTPMQNMAEEIAAYAIENAENAPAGIREIADRMVGAVKAYVLRRFGKQFGAVTPGQLRALAIAALRSREAMTAARNIDGMRASIASSAPTSGKKSAFERAKDKASNFLTDMMVGKGSSPGEFSMLALTPVRPLFMELTDGMPSARNYLDAKQAMDADRNAMNVEADKILQQWTKWASKNKDANTELMRIMHETTLEQYDPSPENRDKNATPNPALQRAYDALPDEAKRLYSVIRDTYSERADAVEAQIIDNVKKAMGHTIRNAERKYNAEMERIRDEGLTGEEKTTAEKAAKDALEMVKTRGRRNKAARLKRMRQYFESNRLQGPYFPLARFGNYFVTVRDEDGKIVSFSKFDKVSQQKAFADEARAIYGKDAVQESLASRKTDEERNLDPRFIATIDSILDNADIDMAVRDQVYQAYLETLPDLSVRKSRLHRKGTAGYNEDAVRAFASQMFHGAHQLARLRFGMQLQDHLAEAATEVRNAPDPVRAEAVMNEIRQAHDFIVNPSTSPAAHHITSAVFLWTMAFNLSSAVVNASQTVTMGVPNLAFDPDTRAGMKNAARQLARSTRDFMIGKGFAGNASTLSDDERAAMKVGYDSGLIEDSQSHDLAGVAESGIDYNPTVQKVMRMASWPMHQVERFNREITYLAAYRIARNAGMDHQNAIRKASDLTWMSHFDNQSSAKPRFMRRDLGRVLFALKAYQANIIFRTFRDLHQALNGVDEDTRKTAVKRFGATFAMTMAVAGIKGSFAYSTIMMIAGAFMGMLGDDDDPDEKLRKAIVDSAGDSMIGRAISGMLMDGVPGYWTGTSISGRMGMADLWFRTNDRALTAEEQWDNFLEQVLGAAVGRAHQAYSGAVELMHGNVQKGLEKMAPAGLANPLKAYRYATEGVRDKDGNPIVENVPVQDLLKQFIGFTPAEIADRRDRNNYQYNTQKRIKSEATEARQGVSRAIIAGDQAAEAKAWKKVDAFNDRYPEYEIRQKSIIQSMRNMQNRSGRMEFGVDLDPKLADRVKGGTAPSIYAR